VATLAQRWRCKIKNQPSLSMTSEFELLFRTREYKDRAIQAASYQVAPDRWVPEACFWHYTERGWRRLWIKSFEHLFATQGLTFPNQQEADNYAFRLARTLIDKTLADLQQPASRRPFALATYLPKMLKGEWPRFAMRKFKHRV